MTFDVADGLGLVAEISIALAGFSGVFIVLGRAGVQTAPERFRIRGLLLGSLGSMFLAMLPFAILSGSMAVTRGWIVLATGATAFSLLQFAHGQLVWPLHKHYAAVFPSWIVVTQTGLSFLAVGLSVSLFAAPLDHKPSIYLSALLVCLIPPTIAFVRLIFYFQHDR